MTTPTNTPTPRTDAMAIPYHAIRLPKFPNGAVDANGKWVSIEDARTLEIENQQLQREAADWKFAAFSVGLYSADTPNNTPELYRNAQADACAKIFSDRDHFKQLAEEWEKMCEELASELSKHNRMPNTVKVLSHFHSLQQQKKDE